jgi:hypothetical protein
MRTSKPCQLAKERHTESQIQRMDLRPRSPELSVRFL